MLLVVVTFLFAALFGWLAFTSAGSSLGAFADAGFLIGVAGFLAVLVRSLGNAMRRHFDDVAQSHIDDHKSGEG